jgi:hypothetical protein
MLRLVLYGCEPWSLTLRAEHRLRVFENRVLRKIFGSKRDEVTGEWRRLHDEELYNLYSSSYSGITVLSGPYPFPKLPIRFLIVEAFQQNIFSMGGVISRTRNLQPA